MEASGDEIQGITYILLEYVPCSHFFDFCKSTGPLDEDCGRFFMEQLVEVLTYLHDIKAVAHLDI